LKIHSNIICPNYLLIVPCTNVSCTRVVSVVNPGSVVITSQTIPTQRHGDFVLDSFRYHSDDRVRDNWWKSAHCRPGSGFDLHGRSRHDLKSDKVDRITSEQL
jgi:hypothetical protein